MSLLFRFHKLTYGAVFLSWMLINPQFLRAEPRFGLWVESEGVHQPFVSAESVDDFLEYSSDAGLSDLYLQVYRNGRSWFPSMMADDTPFREAQKRGADPLRRIIDEAHRRGQKVHAWFNVLRIINNKNAPLIRTIGKSAVLKDSRGNSLLDYDAGGIGPGEVGKNFQLGTPGFWLEPGSVAVRAYVVETIRDLIVAYPDIDGVHLDMVRFPISMRQPGKQGGGSRPAFGFSDQSVERFFEFTGRAVPPISPTLVTKLSQSKTWNTWKRAQVTLLVFQIKELINQIAPQLELSAAVVASPDRAFHEAFQDWSEWLKGGLINTALPMSYTRDTKLVHAYSKHAVANASDADIIMGLGAWLMKKNPPLLSQQGKSAMASGADGVILFSYSNLYGAEGKKTLDYFRKSVFPMLK